MQDTLAGASLTGIRIDVEGPFLLVGYSTPDQGGMQLVHEFVLPSQPNQDAIVSYGYTFESARNSEYVAVRALPQRLVADLQPWLESQSSMADNAGKTELSELLRRFSSVLVDAERSG